MSLSRVARPLLFQNISRSTRSFSSFQNISSSISSSIRSSDNKGGITDSFPIRKFSSSAYEGDNGTFWGRCLRDLRSMGLVPAAVLIACITFTFLEGEQADFGRNYAAVRTEIEKMMDDDSHDDGSRGPLLVRLAWHAAGTYDKTSRNGGSNGATMRFSPEKDDGANNGLSLARQWLEPVKAKFPWISYADLWTLAGAVAIESMGGPHIPWRAGRTDAVDGKSCPPVGRLPDASKEQDHVRAIFSRMGFSDQEMVALIGAHSMGRCHATSSGYVGPWTNAPTTFSNEFFRLLLEEKWTQHSKYGKAQYVDSSGQLMMLPADLSLLKDKQFRKYVELYAKDADKFAKDFAAAFSKLLELGVTFPKDSEYL